MVDGDLGDGFLPGEGGVGGEEDVFRQRAVAGDDGPGLLIGKASSHQRGQGEPGGEAEGQDQDRQQAEGQKKQSDGGKFVFERLHVHTSRPTKR